MPVSYSSPRFQAVDNFGRPLVGGRLYTYVNKTTTPAVSYPEKDGETPNPNPIVLDGRGEAIVWLNTTQIYTFVLFNNLGDLIWTQDDIVGAATQTEINELKGPNGASMLFFQQLLGGVSRPVSSKLAERVSILDYGGFLNGVDDDAPAMNTAIAKAQALGAVLVIPAGTLYLNSFIDDDTANCVLANITRDLHIECQATVKPGPVVIAGSNRDGSLIRIEAEEGPEATGITCSWTGGYFDLSGLTRTFVGLSGLVYGPKFRDVQVSHVVFDHGAQTPTVDNPTGAGGGDTSFAAKEPERISVTYCTFSGPLDIGIYVNGDNNADREGKNAFFGFNRFVNCGNAMALKRNYNWMTAIGNVVEDCGNAILYGVTDGGSANQGRYGSIIGNRIQRVRASPITVENGAYVTVSGNTILDYGREIYNPAVEVPVAVGNQRGAVVLQGASDCAVTGNVLGWQNWEPPSTVNKEGYGVVVRGATISGGTVQSNRNSITGNVLCKTFRPYLFTGDTNDNYYGSNTASIASGGSLEGIDNGVNYLERVSGKSSGVGGAPSTSRLTLYPLEGTVRSLLVSGAESIADPCEIGLPVGVSRTAMGTYTGSTDTRHHLGFLNTNGRVGSISTNGAATSYNTSSDYRLKTTSGLYDNGLSDINRIPVYNARWKADGNDVAVQAMTLAHELQAVIPQAVIGEKDEVDESGRPIVQQVDYSKLVPLLIAAIQDLSKQIGVLSENSL